MKQMTEWHPQSKAEGDQPSPAQVKVKLEQRLRLRLDPRAAWLSILDVDAAAAD